MRSFYIINARASSDIHMKAGARSPELNRSVKRERLRFRDIIWAYHSESQEILLNASAAACGGKMVWSDAKALGIFLWLNNLDSMVGFVYCALAQSTLIVATADTNGGHR